MCRQQIRGGLGRGVTRWIFETCPACPILSHFDVPFVPSDVPFVPSDVPCVGERRGDGAEGFRTLPDRTGHFFAMVLSLYCYCLARGVRRGGCKSLFFGMGLARAGFLGVRV